MPSPGKNTLSRCESSTGMPPTRSVDFSATPRAFPHRPRPNPAGWRARSPGLQREGVAAREVQRGGEDEVHQPQSGAEVEEAEHPLSRPAEPGQVRAEVGEELTHVDARQPDEQAADRVVA